MKNFADRLRWARETAKLDARALDRAADITPGHTRAIELGRRPTPSMQTMEKLARALGVTLDWLVSGTGPRPTERALLAKAAESGVTLPHSTKAAG